MSLSVCPIAVVRASPEAIWRVLANPETYTDWTDAVVGRIVPSGPAQAGQRVEGYTRVLGVKLPVRIEVNGVDANSRTLDLTTHVPFGVTVKNHITVHPLNAGSCQVSFG